jgi:hypothetical protein
MMQETRGGDARGRHAPDARQRLDTGAPPRQRFAASLAGGGGQERLP